MNNNSITLILTCILAFFITNCATKVKKNTSGERPNIIFLMADDMRFDALACNGNPLAITPHADALAKAGTNFTNAYVTTSICMVSRASVLSGQYARRHGINDFSTPFSAAAWQQSYPMLLRQAGYYTGFIGKFGVGNNMPAKDFDYWKGFGGHGVYFYKNEKGEMAHSTAMMGAQMKDFIQTRDASKPFCLSVSFKAPHSEDGVNENNGFRPDPIFDSLYTNTRFPVPPNYHDSFYHRFSKPWRIDDRNKENEARMRFNTRFDGDEKYQTTTRAIYRLVSGIDKVLGELREYLKAQNLDDNTIIVFTSDNGYYLGDHGLEGKWYGHDASIRIPLIIYDPRQKKQRKIAEEIALNIDVAPTMLSWAGIAIPNGMQGANLATLLTSKGKSWRNGFFYEHTYDPGSYPVYIPHTVGWVTTELKYMKYYNGPTSEIAIHEELFQVNKDRNELNNLISMPAFADQLSILRQLVAQHEKSLQ